MFIKNGENNDKNCTNFVPFYFQHNLTPSEINSNTYVQTNNNN